MRPCSVERSTPTAAVSWRAAPPVSWRWGDQPQWSITVIEPTRAATEQTELVLDAPPIVSNVPGSFAWSVLHQRHPALIERVRDAFPYPPDLQRGLDRLLEEIAGTIEALGHQAHDRQVWAAL